MSEEVEIKKQNGSSTFSQKERKLPLITIFRRIVQFLSFFLVNYGILEYIFKTDFGNLHNLLLVLPFLQSAQNSWTAGAGLIEYTFYAITQGTAPYLFIALIGFLGLFTGRFFCGWMCPTGFIQDLLSGLAAEKRKFSIEGDRFLKKIKMYILMVLFIIFVPLGYYKTKDVTKYFDYSEALGDFVKDPIGPFSFSKFLFYTFPNAIRSIIDDMNLESIFTKDDPWKGVFFVAWLLVIAISVYYPRFYCRTLCPYGAFISIFSEYSFLKLKRLPTRCVGRKACGICEQVCDMQVRLLDEPYSGFTGEGECILCLKCMEKCPYDAIKWKFGA